MGYSCYYLGVHGCFGFGWGESCFCFVLGVWEFCLAYLCIFQLLLFAKKSRETKDRNSVMFRNIWKHAAIIILKKIRERS